MRSKVVLLLLLLLLSPAFADCNTPSVGVSIVPERADGGPGVQRNFTAKVTSTASCQPVGCRDRYFLTADAPAGWAASLNESIVSVGCGQSNSTATLSVTPDSTAKSGQSYDVSVQASHENFVTVNAEGVAKFHVPPCSGLTCCGDRICQTGVYPAENRTNCPSDCCPLERNGVCEHYAECGGYDPDCCSLGNCRDRNRFGCDSLKHEYSYCYLTSCGGGSTGCLSPDSNCYGADECGTGFCYNSTTGSGTGPLCEETCAPSSLNPPVVNSFDAGSCCACWDASFSQCVSCGSLQTCLNLTSDGYTIYSGESVSVKYRLNASNCSANSMVSLYIGGPLKGFVHLSKGEKIFDVDTGIYEFSAIVSKVPYYIKPGLYQLKVGARIDNTNQAADVSKVLLTPSVVFESGREISTGNNVAYVSKLAPMSYKDGIVPVKVEVWVW